MMENKKGFTLVELLATLVILGVIMMVAVPNIMGILSNNRNTTYIEDAKKLVTTAEYKLRADNTVTKPTVNGQCVMMSLKYLDNTEFDNPPYDGEYLEQESFVIVKKQADEYHYYVQLIQEVDGSSKSYRGVKFTDSNNLYAENYADYITNVKKGDLANATIAVAALQGHSNIQPVVSCSIIAVYNS